MGGIMNDSLGDRMKKYEDAYRICLPPRMPIIIRVDGKAFHSFTRGCQKPFDSALSEAMDAVSQALLDEIQGARCVYTQSDEASVLIVYYNKFMSQPWFENTLQKIVSISAATATAAFNKDWSAKTLKLSDAHFDSRAFVIPEAEVCNYFIWRQQDATRNSIQMVGQANFSHKQLHGVSCDGIQEMLFQEKQINWNDYEAYWKRGRVISRDGVDRNIPVFTQDRQYIEKFMTIEEK